MIYAYTEATYVPTIIIYVAKGMNSTWNATLHSPLTVESRPTISLSDLGHDAHRPAASACGLAEA